MVSMCGSKIKIASKVKKGRIQVGGLNIMLMLTQC